MKKRMLALLIVFAFALTLMPMTAAPVAAAERAVSQQASVRSVTEQGDPVFNQVPEELNGTKIKMMIWWSSGISDKQKSNTFYEETGIRVAFETATMDKYQSNLSAKILAGNPPAAAAIINEWFPQPIVRGLFQPIENTGWDFTDPIYAQNLMDQFAVRGKHYGIAIKGSATQTFSVMFFNKDFLNKVGVEKDPYELWKEGNWNWDTCLEIAQQCTDPRRDKYGLTIFNHFDWMLSAGQDFVLSNENGLVNNIKNPKLLDTWYHAWDMIYTHKVIPTMFSLQQQLFFNGSVAMLGAGSYMMQAEASHSNYVPQNCDFDWGVVPFPSPKGQDAVAAVQGTVWGFPANVNGNQLQAAAWWLRYYLDDAHYTNRDFFANEQCWEVNDWMYEQEMQVYNSVGAVSYGGRYNSWSIQYSLIDDASTKAQVQANLDSWYDTIESLVQMINWDLQEYYQEVHVCTYQNALDVVCDACGEERTLQYIEENADVVVSFDNPGLCEEWLFVPQVTGEYLFCGDGYSDADVLLLDRQYNELAKGVRDLDKDAVGSCMLTAGETYVLRVVNNGHSGELTVCVRPATALNCLLYDIVDGEVIITDCLEKYSGEMVIPATIEGYPVVAIEEDAFSYCAITSVTIPDSLTTMEPNEFGRCTALTSFVVDEQNICYSSLDGVLFNKDATVLLQYPRGKEGNYTIPNSVTTIGEAAFAHSDITEITIPNSVTSIGKEAFYDCYGLTSVIISDGVITIGEDAFYSCIGLTSVEIPDSVVELGDCVFAGCENLLSVALGEGITCIPYGAFEWCFELKEIVIPSGVTTIESYAFYGCDTQSSVAIGKSYLDGVNMYGSLTDIYYGGSIEDAARMVIEDHNPALTTATWHYNYAPEPEVIPGDADGNGKVNNRDLGTLQRYLNGWNVQVDENALDLDGNGKINNRDLGMLQQYINRGEGEK